MSLEATLEIVDRAIADEEFRTLLLAEPATALKGATLSAAERAMLKGLSSSPYTTSARGLADVRRMVLASLAYDDVRSS